MARRRNIEQKPALNYMTAAAMRGPDISNATLLKLKRDLTARGRAIFFTDGQCLGWHNPAIFTYDEVARTLEDLDTLGEQTMSKAATHAEMRAVEHYLGHVADLLHETRNHEIWGGQAATLCHHVRNIRYKIHDYANDMYSKRRVFKQFGDLS